MARRRNAKTAEDVTVLDDDVRDPVEYYETERAARVALQRTTQLTADVVIDLEGKGALHHFVVAKRREAILALMALVDADPTDAAAIYALQRRVHPYLDACDFIHSTIEAGADADRTIEETFGHDDQSED